MTGPAVRVLTDAERRAAHTHVFVHAEVLARRRLDSGEAGVEVLAAVLDLLDEARSGGPLGSENWQRWARAAGCADLGPEVT